MFSSTDSTKLLRRGKEERDDIFKGRLETLREYKGKEEGEEQLEIIFNRILNDFACLTPLPISCQRAGTVPFCISQKHVKHRYSTSIY